MPLSLLIPVAAPAFAMASAPVIREEPVVLVEVCGGTCAAALTEQADPVPATAAPSAPATVTPPAASPPVASAPAGAAAAVPPAQASDAGAGAGTGGNAITVTGRGPSKADPLQQINVDSYKAVQAVDKGVIRPVAMGYKSVLPRPLRMGIHNVVMLLEEPTVFANFILQHKFGSAVETLGRTAINVTLGVGGLMDVAAKKPFNMPFRVNGFGYTLGYYGIPSGPYLFLPLIGPTTVRDFGGRMADLSLLSVVLTGPFKTPAFGLTRGVIASLDDRVERDAEIKRLRDESPDGYVTMRKAYLMQRKAEIDALKGKPVVLSAKQLDAARAASAPAPVVAPPAPVAAPAAPATATVEVPPAPPLPPETTVPKPAPAP